MSKYYVVSGDILPDVLEQVMQARIFQWLLYVASRQTWKHTAIEIVEIALNEWKEV